MYDAFLITVEKNDCDVYSSRIPIGSEGFSLVLGQRVKHFLFEHCHIMPCAIQYNFCYTFPLLDPLMLSTVLFTSAPYMLSIVGYVH